VGAQLQDLALDPVAELLRVGRGEQVCVGGHASEW
jgi:hypothetical protein